MLYTQSIPASGVLDMRTSGKLFLLDDTGAAASVTVTLAKGNQQIDKGDGAVRGFRVFLPNDSFDQIRIEGAVGAVVRFIVSQYDVQISNNEVRISNTVGDKVPVEVFGAVLTATNVGIASPDTLAGLTDVLIGAGVAAVIVAADAVNTKREVIIKNLSANTEVLRIGAATVNATRGHELAPGESVTLDTAAAISGFNTGAVDQHVSVITNSRA